MALKIIGAGFSKTGTTSLKHAVEQLGFSKCYHMCELSRYISHPRIWTDAFDGKPVDFDSLLEGYQAIFDVPGCLLYRELMEKYPHAKVILSVRDPEQWYESCLTTIYHICRQSRSRWTFRLKPKTRAINRMIYHLFWNGLFDGRFEDRAHAIEVFQRHNDEVQRIVPADRLLVYRVLEGWEPLCEFLGVPVPQHMPFPRANTTEDFLESVAAEQKKNRFLKLLREYNAYAKYWGREIRNLLMSKGRSLHSQ